VTAFWVSPVLHEGAVKVKAYFPTASWYSLWDFSHIAGPSTVTLDVPLTDIPVHVKGGSIIPLQRPAETTAAVRRSAVKLVVALDQVQYLHEQQLQPGSAGAGAGAAAGGPAGAGKVQTSTTSAGTIAGNDAEGSGSSDPGSSASGMQLSCGMMYMDDGDSLEVPPIGEKSSLLLFLSAMVVPGSLQGWLWGVPAAADLAVQGQQSQRVSADGPRQNDAAAAAQAHSPADTGAANLGSVSERSRKVFQHCKHHVGQAHWAAAVWGRLAADASAGDHATATGAPSSGAGSDHHSTTTLHLPFVEEIVVLGVQPPDDGKGYAVWLDEQRLVEPDQVKYDASRHVLHVTLGAAQQSPGGSAHLVLEASGLNQPGNAAQLLEHACHHSNAAAGTPAGDAAG